MAKVSQSFRQRLLLFTACTLCGAVPAASAWAQAATDATGPAQAAPVPSAGTESIVVTGSRIQRSTATNPSPITVVTAEEIAKSSAQTIEDVLQRLPVIGTTGLYGTTNNGGEGASCTDIRNLGITRTLVLVDGRRFVHSGIFGVDCVDLNNIPLALVDRIDVLKDGASAIYGADAVAGVINIILKKHFNGTQIQANGNISGYGDDRTGELSVTSGGDWDKGNIIVNVDYLNREPVEQASRPWAVPVVANNTKGSPTTYGSGIPLNGRVLDSPNATAGTVANMGTVDGTLLSLNNGKPFPDNFRPYNRLTDGYDYGQAQYLQGGLEKESFSAIAHYDFTPNIRGFLETFFTHKISTTELAPQPVTGGLGAGLPDAFVVPAGNPYNPFGEDVALFRRVGEFGDRNVKAETDTFQITGGFEGSLRYGWDYNTFFTYGQSDNTIRSYNEVNFQRLEQEMGFQQQTDLGTAAGAPDPSAYGIYNPSVCNAALGCVLANPFGPNSFSQAAVNYARFTETATSEFSLRDFGGELSNKNVYDLHYGDHLGGPIGLSFGVEHRREQGEYDPDSLVQSGVTLENAQQPTSGAFSVTEVFAEGLIPVIKDVPFIKNFTIDASGRFYDYNTFGNGAIWKVGGNYTPITGLRFRGNIGTAFRQPDINELYGGQALSFNTANDPCANASNGTYGSRQAIVAANCARQGIDVGSFTQLGNGQVQTITGGNPALKPETADVQTAGVVIQPQMIRDLAFTADYYHTKIKSSIGSVDTQTILDNCYTSVNLSDAFCSQIASRNGQQQLSTVTAIEENLGVTKEDGLDLGLDYTYHLPQGWGSLVFTDELDFLFEFLQQNVPNGPFINYTGALIPAAPGNYAYPRVRDNATVTWNYGNFSFGYRLRYIDGMKLYPYTDYIDNPTAKSTTANEVFYHDINITYSRGPLDVTFGIDNLLDKDPPFVPDLTENTDPNIYDILGRVFYLKTSYKF
jgi:outer membrane receptor protein involved in Fe transport